MERRAWGVALLGLLGLLSSVGFKVIEALPGMVAALVIAVLSGAYLLGHWLQQPTQRVALYWRWDWPWWGLVPLNKAAELAFKRLHGTAYEGEALYAPTPEKRLDRMGEILNWEARDIYGRKRPGELRALNWYERRIGHIQGGATRIHGERNPSPTFEDLHIYRWDLWATLKRLRSNQLVNTNATP